jgi:hypothetical protein
LYLEMRMQEFELRFLDRQDGIVLVRRIAARDDAAAMREAHIVSLTHTLEIWQDARLVGRVERPPSRRGYLRSSR